MFVKLGHAVIRHEWLDTGKHRFAVDRHVESHKVVLQKIGLLKMKILGTISQKVCSD